MLWPERYEGLRDEARSMAATLAERYGVEAIAGDATSADPVARLAAQRAGLAALEQESPAGRDESIAGVPCRVFDAGGTSGTYLHFHGGAMIMGSSRMNDIANAELTEDLGVRVVSIDYRLAPEHPFPAGIDDCMAVARAELDRSDGPIVLSGESAGGYYAALTTLRIRDELGAIDRIAGVNLVFGIYDLSGTPSNIQSRSQIDPPPSDRPPATRPFPLGSVHQLIEQPTRPDDRAIGRPRTLVKTTGQTNDDGSVRTRPDLEAAFVAMTCI